MIWSISQSKLNTMTILSVVLDFVFQSKFYILVACALAYVARLYNGSRRLSTFKGPIIARFTDLWFAKAALGDSQHAVSAGVCEKYGTVLRSFRGPQLMHLGSIARIGPNLLVTTSPDLWIRSGSDSSQSLFLVILEFAPFDLV